MESDAIFGKIVEELRWILRPSCWCTRTACWCAGSPPPRVGNWVLRTSKREVKQTSSHTCKGARLNSNKCVSNSLSLSEDRWIVEFIDYSHLPIILFRYLWCNHCEPPPSLSHPHPPNTWCSSTEVENKARPGSKFRCCHLLNGWLASHFITWNCIFFNCTTEPLLMVVLWGLNGGGKNEPKVLSIESIH